MSIMDEGKRPKRVRRSFTDEFKAGAVRLVLDEGKTISQVARDLDVLRSSLELWVKRARADRDGGKSGLTTDELRSGSFVKILRARRTTARME